MASTECNCGVDQPPRVVESGFATRTFAGYVYVASCLRGLAMRESHGLAHEISLCQSSLYKAQYHGWQRNSITNFKKMATTSTTPSFSFSQLSPSSQLSMASHMSYSALIDFALGSPAFSAYLTQNLDQVVLACLSTQYGYRPDITPSSHLNPIFPATFASDSTELRILTAHPLLNLLMLEERVCTLPEHKSLLELLASSTKTELTPEEQEELYGPGVRGLLRYIMRYHALRCEIRSPEARWRRMAEFLESHYTPWGVHEIEAVYEILCDIVVSRITAAGFGRVEDLGATCAYLIAGLDVLEMPRRGVCGWVMEREAARNIECGDAKKEHRWFFLKPVGGGEEGDWAGKGDQLKEAVVFPIGFEIPKCQNRTRKGQGGETKKGLWEALGLRG